jgi:hypothetical protein
MNFASSISGAASVFAAGGLAGGLACAIAPDIIKALMAAEIMSFLSIAASTSIYCSKEIALCAGPLITRERRARSRVVEPDVHAFLMLRSAIRPVGA